MIAKSLIVTVILGAGLFSADQPREATNAEQQIRALETIRLKFPNKTGEWSRHVAPDALFHQGSGIVVGADEFLQDLQKHSFEDSLEMLDTQFRQIGDAAIFSYVFKRVRHDDANAICHLHVRRTVVYLRIKSGWQMITSAVSVIPYADLESKPVDPKILDTYIGVWPDTPAPATVTLTRDGSKLMAQGSHEKVKTPLLALSDNTFVVRGEPAQITFEKGPDGQVTRVLQRDIGGSVEVQERARVADRQRQ
jgi:Domain of unknown function (DUF3471)